MTNRLGRSSLPLFAIEVATEGKPYPLDGRTRLTKLVFLAQREASAAVRALIAPDEPYSYKPYHFGPFSSDLLADLEALEVSGLVNIEEETLDSAGRVTQYLYSLTGEGRKQIGEIEAAGSAASEVRSVLEKYASLTRGKLVEYVYSKYPDSVKA